MPKPNIVFCYICNREFGSKSIDIHEPQCLAKWEIENNQLPKSQRRLKPLKPCLDNSQGDQYQVYDYEKYNQDAWNSSQGQLLECKYCKRTFNPDRLPVHQKSCKEGKPLSLLKVSKKKSDNGKKAHLIERPGTATLISPQILDTSENYIDMTSQRINKDTDIKQRKVSLNKVEQFEETAVTCYLCGDKVDGKTVSKHEALCIERFNTNNSKISSSKKKSSPNKTLIRGQSAQPIKRKKSPSKLSSGKENLSPCPHCGESFLSENLESHIKNCLNQSKALTTSNENNKKKLSCRKCRHEINPKYNFCPNCGRPCSHKNCAHKETKESSGTPMSPQRKSSTSSKSPNSSNQNSPSKKEISSLPSKPDIDMTLKTTVISRELPTVFCYICGRQFGTASIAIHEPQCLEKWKIQNDKLPKEQRRLVPQKPDLQGKTKEEINIIAYESAKQQLLSCSNCGRTFAPDRLPVHQKSCKPKSEDSATKLKSKGQAPPLSNDAQSSKKVNSTIINKPRTVVCYVCSREFGTKSIGIHEPQCLEKWRSENNKLPKELRKSSPQKPEGFNVNNSADMEAYNEAANASSKLQLAACPNCSRTFNPDRLSVHLKSCKSK